MNNKLPKRHLKTYVHPHIYYYEIQKIFIYIVPTLLEKYFRGILDPKYVEKYDKCILYKKVLLSIDLHTVN